MISFIHLDIDNCAEKLCNGKGQCKDGINDYTCQCEQGYTGKDCQISEKKSLGRLSKGLEK